MVNIATRCVALLAFALQFLKSAGAGFGNQNHDPKYHIKQGGYCIDYNAEKEQLILFECDQTWSNIRQLWTYNEELIELWGSGKCMSVEKDKYEEDGTPANHARIQLTDCDEKDRYQKWVYREMNHHIFLKEWPKKCLDYNDNLIQQGYILLWDCRDYDDTPNQVFDVVLKDEKLKDFSLPSKLQLLTATRSPAGLCLAGLGAAVFFFFFVFAAQRATRRYTLREYEVADGGSEALALRSQA